MAVLDVQDASDGGAVTLVAAAAGGDQAASGTLAGGWELPVVLLVRNDDAASMDVTVDGVETTVPAGGVAVVPVRGGVAFGDPVGVAYSSVTGVTVGAARLARP